MLAPPPPAPTPYTRVLKQAFLYGLEGIDELIAVYTAHPTAGGPDTVHYVWSDAGGNIVGAANAADASFVAQVRYEPYAGVLAYETADAVDRDPLDPAVAVAFPFFHQGLLLDRETGNYFNRARHYKPVWGRFLQRDPNETGLLLAAATLFNAQTPTAFASATPSGQYSDGLDLYQYLSSNPVSASEPGR